MLEQYRVELIETAVVVLSYFGFKFGFARSSEKVASKFGYQRSRVTIMKKLVNFCLFLIGLGVLAFIWGVDQNELLFFISSLLTVIGIAFFAQWSILSNITATLIIFFNHPAKIGDPITIMDKDFQVDGAIHDIGVFFIVVKTTEGEKVTIPSNIFIQKMVKWQSKPT